jgi:hypothetical protein
MSARVASETLRPLRASRKIRACSAVRRRGVVEEFFLDGVPVEPAIVDSRRVPWRELARVLVRQRRRAGYATVRSAARTAPASAIRPGSPNKHDRWP